MHIELHCVMYILYMLRATQPDFFLYIYNVMLRATQPDNSTTMHAHCYFMAPPWGLSTPRAQK